MEVENTPSSEPTGQAPQQKTPVNNAPVAQQSDNVQSFNIPDDYKEKGWAKNIKTDVDLWKTLDNAQALIGKKTIGLPDWDNEEQVKAYYDKVKPEKYDFGDSVKPEEAPIYQDFANKLGLSNKQARDMAKSYNELVKQGSSQEGFVAEMKKSFGDGYEKDVAVINNHLKESLSKEDIALYERLPNAEIGIINRAVNSIIKKYGANDGDVSLNKSGGKTVVDRDALYKELYKIEGRGDFEAEKKLKDQINKSYGK